MKDTLGKDHAELDELLKDLFAGLRKNDVEASFRALDLFWARLALHIRAEHLHLFPALLNSENTARADSLPAALTELRADHDYFMHELADAVKQMRAAIAAGEEDVPAGVRSIIAAVALRLARHNQIEESRIYPLAGSFPAATLDDLDEKIDKELKNLPPRFSGGDAGPSPEPEK